MFTNVRTTCFAFLQEYLFTRTVCTQFRPRTIESSNQMSVAPGSASPLCTLRDRGLHETQRERLEQPKQTPPPFTITINRASRDDDAR